VAVAVLISLIGAAAGFAQPDDGLTESPDGPEAVKVYYTPEEALGKVFAEADSLWTDTWRPMANELEAMETKMGWLLPDEEITFHRGRRGNSDLGYAVILEEQGRFKPITFIVKISPEAEVEMVLVMVYRESRGDGVKRQRFLKQFRRKDESDPLRLNRDVVGVSGATMSSRAITKGVKKALVLVNQRYRKTQ
jgi:hypothetical protein